MKKGQFERSFSMILTIIIIGMIVFLGYKGIYGFVKFQKEQEYTSFIDNFNSLIEKYKEYGSYKKTRIILPGKDSVMCIFDNTLEENRRSIIEDFEGKEFLQEYWLLLDEKDDNIIFYPSKKTFKNNNVYFGEKILGSRINEDYKGYICFTKKVNNIILEGTGMKVKIKIE